MNCEWVVILMCCVNVLLETAKPSSLSPGQQSNVVIRNQVVYN